MQGVLESRKQNNHASSIIFLQQSKCKYMICLQVKKLCENCGKLAKHKSDECPKLLGEDAEEIPETENNVEDINVKKKYVPVHLSGKSHLIKSNVTWDQMS